MGTQCLILPNRAPRRENEDPRTSPHLRAPASSDRLDSLAALLARADLARPFSATRTRLLAVKALKILARRQDVRLRCSQHTLEVLVGLLDVGGSAGGGGSRTTSPVPSGKGGRAPAGTPAGAGGAAAAELASEAANAISNCCYEASNASGLLRAGGVARLLGLLDAPGAGGEAHTNAAAALQTLSFQGDGRGALLKAGAPAALLHRLSSMHCTDGGSGEDGGERGGSDTGDAEGKLQQRLVGALHNLSSSAEGIVAIAAQGGVPAIVQLLRSRHAGVAASAAGALQNLALEAQVRADIRAQPTALPALVELLIGSDTQVGEGSGGGGGEAGAEGGEEACRGPG